MSQIYTEQGWLNAAIMSYLVVLTEILCGVKEAEVVSN